MLQAAADLYNINLHIVSTQGPSFDRPIMPAGGVAAETQTATLVYSDGNHYDAALLEQS
jgi:hypothetical protein